MLTRKGFLLLIFTICLAVVLRLYKITSIPPALHGDELGIAYNAYSLLKTGRDEYGKLFPLSFRNDFAPVIFYFTIPFTLILGLSEYAVRLPSAIVSVFALPSLYLLINSLFKNKKLAFLTIFLLSVSSWDVRIARIGVGITLALFFQLSATILFLKALKSKRILFIFSFLLFSFSLFTYQTPKITSPLLLISLIIIYRNRTIIKKNLKYLMFLFLIFIILPSIFYFIERPISDTRFAAISIFTLWRSYPDSSIFKLIFMFISNYVKHFNPNLLFIDNSLLRYHELTNQGLFYLWQAPFMILGLIHYLTNFKNKDSKLILCWLFLSPIPSSLSTGVPYANVSRGLMILPFALILIAKGLLVTFQYIKSRFGNFNILNIGIVILTSISIYVFTITYFITDPPKHEVFWGAPLKKAALSIKLQEKYFDKIVFTTELSPQSYMYLLFYSKIDPSWLLVNKGDRAKIVGFKTMGKYEFRPIDWEKDKNLTNALLIGTVEEIPIKQDEEELIFYKTPQVK